jgi:lysophospholipase L1-like esterase
MRLFLLFAILVLTSIPASAQRGQKWVTSWAASAHGPYPSGNASAQPNLRFAFPTPEQGARRQTMRMIVQPDIWGQQARIRLSNAMGTRPVTFRHATVALQLSGAALVPNTKAGVRFGGSDHVTVQPGQWVWSDPVTLAIPSAPSTITSGRKLAVSFHVDDSGPMTWHAKALQTSYLTAPGSEIRSDDEGEAAFPYSTTSWFFLDAVDMMVPGDTKLIVCYGDSITDGTGSTLNGDDRWPNVLSRRLHAAYGEKFSVVNAGIGGNQVTGPKEYSPQSPVPGGPSAVQRLERDVLSLSGLSAIVWLEGINDLGRGASVESVEAGMKQVVARVRSSSPGVKVIAATLVSALGAAGTRGNHGSPEEDRKRKALNEFIRTSGLFDGVADFDRATLNTATGELRPEFVPDSTVGGPGDKLHPNRAGYLAMGMSIDLKLLVDSR